MKPFLLLQPPQETQTSDGQQMKEDLRVDVERFHCVVCDQLQNIAQTDKFVKIYFALVPQKVRFRHQKHVQQDEPVIDVDQAVPFPSSCRENLSVFGEQLLRSNQIFHFSLDYSDCKLKQKSKVNNQILK